MHWRKVPFEQRLAWLLAVYCFAVVAVYGWKPVFTNSSQPVRGITDPVIALQMVHTVDEVDAVLGDSPSADREIMRVKQYVDFALIPGYAALAILLTWILTRGIRGPWFYILTALAVMAGISDVRENLLILHTVNLPLSDVSHSLLESLHFSSIVKWRSLAIASLLLGYLLIAFAPSRSALRIAVAAINLLGGALTLIGLSANSLLLWGAITQIAGLLLSAAILNVSQHESVT